MTDKIVDISDRVRALTGALDIKIDERGRGEGNKKAYLDNLTEAMEHHGAFTELAKKLPKVLDNDGTVETKTAAVVDLVKSQSENFARAIHDYDAEIFAAVALGTGEAAQAFIAKNPDVNRVIVKVAGIGRNHFDAVYDQNYNKTIPKGKGEPVEVIPSYGRVNVAHSVYGNRGSAQQMKAVRHTLQEAAVALAKRLNK